MSSRPDLKLDWCSYQAAKYAVEHWHYSKTLPTPPLVRIGVWEDNRFIGAIIFSRGASHNLGKPYNVTSTEVAELTRVALTTHKSAVSRILSIAIKMLTSKEKGLRVLISYADPNHGHIGNIYQATNWVYTGQTSPDTQYIYRGHVYHSRQVRTSGIARQYGRYRLTPRPEQCIVKYLEGKYRYVYPLDEPMRQYVSTLSKPYPKRSTSATNIDSDVTAPHAVKGGASPTVALQT